LRQDQTGQKKGKKRGEDTLCSGTPVGQKCMGNARETIGEKGLRWRGRKDRAEKRAEGERDALPC